MLADERQSDDGSSNYGVVLDNPDRERDRSLVATFMTLKARPNRPIDDCVTVRPIEQSRRISARLGEQFFEPLNRLLTLIGNGSMKPIRVEPDPAALAQWNRKDFDFARSLAEAVLGHLDGAQSAAPLVTCLVDVFRNLEREHHPGASDWERLDAIVVPGSRTFDRAAEAFRAFGRTRGKAHVITSGKAPYYDPDPAQLRPTESEANAAYLRLLGVPADRILVEADAMDTVENAEYLPWAMEEITGSSTVPCVLLLVTSPSHLARFQLNVRLMFERTAREVAIFALASTVNRYWPEPWFLADQAPQQARADALALVFNEYLKIAFDVCAEISSDRRPRLLKQEAVRSGTPKLELSRTKSGCNS